MSNPFRQLPAVSDVLNEPSLQESLQRLGRDAVVAEIRLQLQAFRAGLRSQDAVPIPDARTLAEAVNQRLQTTHRPKLRAVINATGIVLHTNLGRAPLAEAAAQAAYEAGRGYLNLELDLVTGKRSSRQDAVREWLCKLTGAESATVVNNNAAATVLALRTFCYGKEVLISRGQLIEIGGSFRIPEILTASGAVLREVGATNITRLSDYERAVSPNTAAILLVHPSNYRIAGFTESVPLPELVRLGKERNLLVMDDIGSGALVDFAEFGFREEPLARRSIAQGADLVLFSGDKLLGGPQAGILAGRKDLVARLEKDPLMRAFRLDKMTLAALEATLRLYLNEATARSTIPVLAMLSLSQEELQTRAETLAQRLQAQAGIEVRCLEDVAYVGGGSLPDQEMPTWVVELTPTSMSDAELAVRLRVGNPAVLVRVQEGRLRLDLRTIMPRQIDDLVAAIAQAAK